MSSYPLHCLHLGPVHHHLLLVAFQPFRWISLLSCLPSSVYFQNSSQNDSFKNKTSYYYSPQNFLVIPEPTQSEKIAPYSSLKGGTWSGPTLFSLVCLPSHWLPCCSIDMLSVFLLRGLETCYFSLPWNTLLCDLVPLFLPVFMSLFKWYPIVKIFYDHSF